MDDNNLEEEQKQAERDQASQKTAHVAGKAAATYFGGSLGTKAYDLASKTKVGQGIENAAGKALQKQPGLNKTMEGLNKSGALDAADKGLDLAGGDGGSLNPAGKGLSNIPANVSGPGSTAGQGQSNPFSNLGDSNEDSASNDSDSSSFGFSIGLSKKGKKTIIISVLSSFVVLLFLVIIIAAIYLPFYNTGKYIQGIFDKVVDFFTKDQQELEEEYYETLKEVQDEMNADSDGKICVDINLITAALTAGNSFEEMLDEGKDNVENAEELVNDDGSVSSTLDYKKMKKNIKLLARMQVMTKKYGLDKSYKQSNGDYCKDSEEEVLVDSSNQGSFERSPFYWLGESSNIDSSTPELIAGHDKINFSAFFSKKVNEETNYAYYLYYPEVSYEDRKDINGNVVKDANGNAIRDRECDNTLPDDEYELSIGNFSTMEDSIFYWNLVNSFIPDYYDEYLPTIEPDRTESIKRIAEEIYLLYDSVGPSQTCSVSYAGPSRLCPNGITVENVGTLDLEEYVAGVVSNEAYTSEGMEALKAQAVAARTYALKTTNYCQSSIANSTNAQTFTRDINDRARQAAKETMGEVLTYNGDIFSSQYDSFCYDDNDCPDATRNNDGTYSVIYTKVPNGEKHTITLNDNSQYERITYGQGHAHGMSQLVSYQLAKEGQNYEQILSYFYSDGVEITFVEPIGGSAGVVAGGSVQEKLAYLFPSGLPGSNNEASQYMTTVEFPVVDINGNRSTKRATVHQAVAQDFVDIMTEIANSGFPIKDVGCYNWRNAASSTSRSHHSYGVACDLNVNENYMIKNGQVVAGSYYKPGDDPYSFPANGVVVKTFTKYDWGWGGSWSNSKDYMHFSFTGY